MNRNDDIEIMSDEEAVEFFKDLPLPFTVTVSTPQEAMMLGQALLYDMCGCNRELAIKTMKLMSDASHVVGPEEAVKICFDEASKSGRTYPKFIIPIFIHMMTYYASKRKE